MAIRGRLFAACAAGVAAAAVLYAPPAAAEFTENDIGCAGSATIQSDDGVFEVDASDSVAEVPRDGSASWQGSVDVATHNHSGEITLRVGPLSVPVGDWGPSENEDDEAAAAGVKDIPSELALVPPGLYRVEGFHEGDEGRCAGFVDLEVTGNPITTPVGAGVAAGTVVTAALLALAAKVKLP